MCFRIQVTAYKYGLQYGVTAYLTNTVRLSICPADVLMHCLRAHKCIVRVKGLELLTESIIINIGDPVKPSIHIHRIIISKYCINDILVISLQGSGVQPLFVSEHRLKQLVLKM